jgi:hypothetical protein
VGQRVNIGLNLQYRWLWEEKKFCIQSGGDLLIRFPLMVVFTASLPSFILWMKIYSIVIYQ